MSDSLAHLNWRSFPQRLLDEAMRGINWEVLCQLASDLHNGTPCALLPKTNAGLNNLVRVLEFADGTRWVARIPLHLGKRVQDLVNFRTEVDTMQLIYERCGADLPVPQIFAYEADTKNRVGVAFILMELLPANTAMDSAGGYSVHRGVIPREHRLNFHRSVARFHVRLTGLRFPKIGTIIKRADAAGGGFDIGLLPGLGGPFDTASAFLEAWANHVTFATTHDEIRRMMPADQPQLTERIIHAIETFPAQIKAFVAHRPPSARDNGPFPLAHTDFLHSNILVDATTFNAVGVIDWEGAQTVPWECVAFPDFLTAMPPVFDLPAKYNHATGRPLDTETQELWWERERYVGLVRAAEQVAASSTEGGGGGGGDGMLSASLSDDNNQALAYALMAYGDIGKLGFYDLVIKQPWDAIGKPEQ